MKPEVVKKILSQTQEAYNSIASDFDQTRSYLWPGLKSFERFVKPGSLILDLGCGNGKLRLLFKKIEINYTGIDNSLELLKIAENKTDFKLARQKFVQADVFDLPFADNSFDLIFFVAVLHHLPGQDLRRQTLREIKRVLKPGGVLVMTNWNRYKKEFLKYLLQYTASKLIGKSELDFKDTYLPWMQGKAHRYYHCFTLGELAKLTKQSGLELTENYLADWSGKKVKSTAYLTASNLVTIAKKC